MDSEKIDSDRYRFIRDTRFSNSELKEILRAKGDCLDCKIDELISMKENKTMFFLDEKRVQND